MSNEKDILNELGTAFEEFKNTNDQRLAAIESKGSADVLIEEKTAAINTRLSELEAELKAARRPEVADKDEADAEYRTAFNDYARKGRNEAELQAKAMAGTTNSGADGGYAIPSVIDSNISQKVQLLSPVRSLAKVISVSTPNYTHLVNLRGTASGWVAEAAARTETASPQLLQVAIPMGDLYANPSATQQVLDDAMFDIEGFLADNIAVEFARAEGAAFVSGDGSNKPSGILAAAPTSSGSNTAIKYIPGGDAAALTDANAPGALIKMVYDLASPYRARAKWALNSATMGLARTLKDSTGRYLWAPGLADGQPQTLVGYEAVEVPDMANVAANSISALFGDFESAYLIVDRKGVTTIRDQYTNKPYIMFYTVKRVGGKLVLPEALRALKVAVS